LGNYNSNPFCIDQIELRKQTNTSCQSGVGYRSFYGRSTGFSFEFQFYFTCIRFSISPSLIRFVFSNLSLSCDLIPPPTPAGRRRQLPASARERRQPGRRRGSEAACGGGPRPWRRPGAATGSGRCGFQPGRRAAGWRRCLAGLARVPGGEGRGQTRKGASHSGRGSVRSCRLKHRAGEGWGPNRDGAIRALRTWEACALGSFAATASGSAASRFERFFSRMMLKRPPSVSFRFGMQ
jgi:hypothetical protein